MSEHANDSKRRRRTISLVAIALVVAVVAAVPVAGRIRQQAEVERDVAAARDFDGFPLYWVGERFEGWDLRAVELPSRATYGFANLVYGDCEVEDPDGFFGPEGGSCTPPLQIQITPLCFHLDAVARAPVWQRRAIRGAPVGASGGGPVLFTRGAQVKVYRGQGSTLGLGLRALGAIRSLNAVAPVVAETGPIPAPDRRILTGKRPCRDSRPGLTLIDENRGTYRGVGIGASADAVRRVLGPRAFARLYEEPWSPTNVTSFAEIGGPNVLTPPCRPMRRTPGGRSPLQLLRYPNVSFALCDGRVFALLVVDRHARTRAGVRVGDDLEQARTLYRVRCGAVSSGDSGRYPFCVTRLRPQRSLWFGRDPIASITISTTRFGVEGER